MIHLIVLTINGDDYTADHPDHAVITPEELTRQGAYANQDAGGLYGYESWSVVHNASQGLLNAIQAEHDTTVPQERIDALTQDPRL